MWACMCEPCLGILCDLLSGLYLRFSLSDYLFGVVARPVFTQNTHLVLCGCHFIGTRHSFPFLTCHFPANHWLTCVLSSETSLGPDCLALCPEKRHASGACAAERVDSCVNCHLAFIAWPVESTHADKRLHGSRHRTCRFLWWPQ